MLRLYTLWELEREVTPEEFQHILTPETALEKATYCYDLDYRNALLPPFSEVPRRLSTRKDKPYKRADRSLYDPVYDALEMNLLEGWIIGLDSNEPWDNAVNPFHINIDGELVFECADPFCWVISEFQRAYQLAINNQNGKKPAPTEKFRPSGEPLQHVQAAKRPSTAKLPAVCWPLAEFITAILRGSEKPRSSLVAMRPPVTLRSWITKG